MSITHYWRFWARMPGNPCCSLTWCCGTGCEFCKSIKPLEKEAQAGGARPHLQSQHVLALPLLPLLLPRAVVARWSPGRVWPDAL
jgi:hypothetical protein